jgi:site-specific DNA-methyltransferase (adenine-specific)
MLGKTYCVGALFIKYYKQYNKLNALIITPSPTETMPQFTDDMFNKFRDFNHINIIEIKCSADIPTVELPKNNIIIISKQLLDGYVGDGIILPFANINLNFIVFDENHFHGTTDKVSDIYKTYATEDTIKLYLTATYIKSLYKWNIPTKCCFYWNIEDEQLCKKRDFAGLATRHDNVELFKHHDLSVYDKMPEMYIITNTKDSTRYDDLYLRVKDTQYGYSNGTLLSGSYSDEVDLLLRFITGSNKEHDFPNGDISAFGRIKSISIDSRTKLTNNNFTSQLWFLPFGIGNKLDEVSNYLKSRMLKNKILSKYEIFIANSKQKHNNIKQIIANEELRAKKNGKNGLIILAGAQLTLGITLPLVDIVVLLTDCESSDRITQMSYRCMTERIESEEMNEINNDVKKYGFVVDMSLTRVLTIMLNSTNCDKNDHDKIKYIIQRNLMSIDGDLYNYENGNDDLLKLLHDKLVKDSIINIDSIVRSIKAQTIELNPDDEIKFNTEFSGAKKESVKITMTGSEKLPSGLSVDRQHSDKPKKKIAVCRITFHEDVLPYFIPFINILTIGYIKDDLVKLINIIKDNPNLLTIYKEQSKIWWDSENTIDLILHLVQTYIKKDSKIYNMTIQIKSNLRSLIYTPDKLLDYIDARLKPKQLEKREFGEVFTPMKIINEMLDAIDSYYMEHESESIFKNPKLKWYDPAAGMGNFPVAIYLRLMSGLDTLISDEESRRKHIITKMLYMGELNNKNCFIIKTIFGKYKLNLYKGDTLKIDTKVVFKCSCFDVIIGNPPYNEPLTREGANALYHKFVEKYIDKCNLLSFIIPSRWFSGGKGLDIFRYNMLQRSDIPYIKHFDNASKIFSNNVQIEGGVNYFLKDNAYEGPCLFNGSITILNRYDVFIDGKYHPIIDKIIQYDSIIEIFLGRYFKIETNSKKIKDSKSKLDIKCYVSQLKGFERYIPKTEITKDYNFYKVITARANGCYKCFGNIFIGTPEEVHTGSYISFKVESLAQAESLLSYLKCKLPNFMLSLRKCSQDISKSTCKWIPLPPLDRQWTDELIYKHFELTKDEIDLINDTKLHGYNLNKENKQDEEPCKIVRRKSKRNI